MAIKFNSGLHQRRFSRIAVLASVALAIIATMLQALQVVGAITWASLWQVQSGSFTIWLMDLLIISGALALSRFGKHLDQVEERNRQSDGRYKQMSELREIADNANKAKSEFLANMSHEIRTPMNAIIGMSYLMRKSQLTEKQLDYNSKIETAAHNLLRIIDDILDFSKIEAGKLSLEVTNLYLEELVAEVAATVNVKLQNKPELEMVTYLDPGIPPVILGDSVRLRQVLLNLADNASKFTTKGEIRISAKVLQKMSYGIVIQFRVKDTGVGMSQEVIQKLFRPFQQADVSTTRKFGGTGLGLAISRSIVHMMDGELEVTSTPGQGSEFYFNAFFSLQVDAPPAEQQQQPAPSFQGLRVLLVDDLESCRMILSEIMRSFGLEVQVTSNPQDALEIFHNARTSGRPFSLLIVDWQMPGMDGLRLISELRQREGGENVPTVLMATAYSHEKVKAAERDKLIDGLILKPANPSNLYDMLNRLFGLGKKMTMESRMETIDIAEFHRLLHGKRVLVAEDNEINMELAMELLQDVGITAESVSNGREAIDVLRKKEFDLVLMDIQMPEMDGLTATRMIRENLMLSKLPVVAMTAHAMKGEREKSLAAGMNEHVTKPIDPKHFYEVLTRFIGNSAATPEPGNATAEPGGEEAIRIEGVDTETGIRRAAGKAKVYRKLLRKFVSNYGNFTPRTELLMQQNRFEEAGVLLHTLAGVAGNIGITEIYEKAHQLSGDFKEHIKNGFSSFLDIHQHKIRELATRLNDYLSRIHDFLGDEEDEPESTDSISGLKLQELLNELSGLIEGNDPAAIQKCKQVIRNGALTDDSRRKLLEVIHHLDNFDFDEADKIFSTIKPIKENG